MKKPRKKSEDDLLPEYNFDYSKGVRGKYFKRLIREGANVVVLEPDVAKAFGDSASVNKVLRALLPLVRPSRRTTKSLRRHSAPSSAPR